MRIVILGLMMVFATANVLAEEDAWTEATPVEIIKLSEVQTDGGKPLMQALKERKTSRAYSEKEVSDQILSELLWAAFGINRPDSGKRTAPTAMNMQEIDIYVAMKKGLYFYEPKQHILKLVLNKDIRKITGKQDFVADAPVNLIFVADYSRMDSVGDMKEFYSAIDTGYISQNVYLYCASKGLATVARGWVDKEELNKTMDLGSEKKIMLTQTVGYGK